MDHFACTCTFGAVSEDYPTVAILGILIALFAIWDIDLGLGSITNCKWKTNIWISHQKCFPSKWVQNGSLILCGIFLGPIGGPLSFPDPGISRILFSNSWSDSISNDSHSSCKFPGFCPFDTWSALDWMYYLGSMLDLSQDNSFPHSNIFWVRRCFQLSLSYGQHFAECLMNNVLVPGGRNELREKWWRFSHLSWRNVHPRIPEWTQ